MALSIDDFKVTGTILSGVQNYWGKCKMYSEFMEKVGRLMLCNLRKVALKWPVHLSRALDWHFTVCPSPYT